MKLYHKKYFLNDKKDERETVKEEIPPANSGTEYIINQAIIWIIIVFISIVIIKKFF